MIYFDNGATTPVCDEAVTAVNAAFSTFGNPSSMHELGNIANNRIKKCTAAIEKTIGAENGTFFFTSGATEANNWAVFGSAYALYKNGKHIITARTEHPSVLEPISVLEKNGFEVSYVGADKRGNIDIDEICGAVRDDTILVSIMYVNNETGVINDVVSIADGIKRINKRTVFHTDAVAAYGKIPVSVGTGNIDLLSVSGHKLHSPKGIGGLYIKKRTRINPLIYGGGQQSNMRSGTENVPYIEAFAASGYMCAKELKENFEKARQLKKRLAEGVLRFECAEINGEASAGKSSPYVLNIGFRGCKSQIIINALESRGIYVSAGSACSSKNTLNKSLAALGIDNALIDGAVRFSFSKYNNPDEVDMCINALSDILLKYGSKK